MKRWILASLVFLASAAGAAERTMDVREAERALAILAAPVDNLEELVTEKSVEGVTYRPAIAYTLEQLRQSGFYLDVDAAWISKTGQGYLEDPAKLKKASMDDVRRMLSAIARQEKFSPGLIGRAIMAGVYQHAADRFRELRKTSK